MNNKRAFTLVELIVVISITGLLAALVFASMRSGGRIVDLKSDSQKLAGVFKTAQMNALSGKQTDTTRPQGYGVYVTETSYILFADVGDNNKYVAGEDIDIQTFDFTEHVTAFEIDNASTVFEIPTGDVYVNGASLTGLNIIELEHAGLSDVIYIKINKQGEINIY